MITQSPRKKRDFYGKSSGTPTSCNKSHRQTNKSDSIPSNKNRPSSTPACTGDFLISIPPDRPVSNPPTKTLL